MNEETTTILVDTALASGSASALDPEERALQELVLAVRDDAPTPDAGFELRMNARVAAGFPRKPGGAGGRVRALLTTRPQLAAMGAVASLLIALVVVVALSGSGSSTDRQSSSPASGGTADSASGSQAQSSASTTAVPAQKSVAPSSGSSPPSFAGPAAPVLPSPGGFVGGGNRKVQRSAELVLAPAQDKLSQVGDQVIAVTDRYRGIVLHSSVTSAGGNGSSGAFDLRIPSANLRSALRDLSALADVQSRTENADDVTASFVSARTRLQELMAERRGLLRRLESAPTDQAVSAIHARLRIVNAQIQAQNATLTEMKRRTQYASVSVSLQAKQGGSGGGGISGGADDLRDSLVDAANIALRVLGVALPIALLVGLLWAGGGWLTRRRRESVLG
jgi:hypothetical protein